MKIHRYASGLLICLAFSTQVAFGDTQAFVKTESLHVRSTPSIEGASIGGLKKNDRILVEKNLGDWLQVSLDGSKGYIASRMVEVAKISPVGQTTPSATFKVGNSGVSISPGETISYYAKSDEYVLIAKNSRLYYVHQSMLNLPQLANGVSKEQPAPRKAQGSESPEQKEGENITGKTVEQTLFEPEDLNPTPIPVFEQGDSTLFASPESSTPDENPGTSPKESKSEVKPETPKEIAPATSKVNEGAGSETGNQSVIPAGKKPADARAPGEIKTSEQPKEASKKEEPKIISKRPIAIEQDALTVTRGGREAQEILYGDGGNALLNNAFSLMGTPYVYAAKGPEGFDCSGFTCYVFEQSGIKIPRTSEDQSQKGTTISYAELRPGDLMFFDTRSSVRPGDITDSADPDSAPSIKPSKVTHVGIYIGDGKMIHASSSQRKVIVADITKGYFSQRLVTIKRY